MGELVKKLNAQQASIVLSDWAMGVCWFCKDIAEHIVWSEGVETTSRASTTSLYAECPLAGSTSTRWGQPTSLIRRLEKVGLL